MESLLKTVRKIVAVNSVKGYNIFKYLNSINSDAIKCFQIIDILKKFDRSNVKLNQLIRSVRGNDLSINERIKLDVLKRVLTVGYGKPKCVITHTIDTEPNISGGGSRSVVVEEDISVLTHVHTISLSAESVNNISNQITVYDNFMIQTKYVVCCVINPIRQIHHFIQTHHRCTTQHTRSSRTRVIINYILHYTQSYIYNSSLR